ncbi:disulfide bond formation protein B [Pseudoduganella sp. R-34]|uniref:disulfide bond formation protein B n=1 Tax=unclassified Pseudoduganella TaxID=2637179 RepID=UPI003CEFB744
MKLNRLIDSLTLMGVCLVLLIAFYFQLFMDELPCSLCNLERAGFLLFGGGLLLNVRQEEASNANYVLAALGALVGSVISLMHMFVKVLPGTPPTGTTFLGLHMYTASYLALTAAVLYCVCMLALAPRLGKRTVACSASWTRVASTLFAVLVFANLVSAFLEIGFHPFKPGGQQHYLMLYDGDVMKP